MRKKGFTVTELLVTVGIIGVIAAITAPSLFGKLPDKEKVNVIRAVDMISKANESILDDLAKYIEENEEDGTPVCIGLGCYGPSHRDMDEYDDGGLYDGANKYITFLSEELNVPNANPMTIFPGTTVQILQGDLPAGGTTGYQATLIINTGDGDLCIYGGGCTHPSVFRFRMDAGGHVTPDPCDALSNIFIENRQKLNDRKADREAATERLNVTPACA